MPSSHRPSFRALGCSLVCTLAGCQRGEDLPTVPELDVSRYMGRWQEVASLPQWFQQGCRGTEALYTLKEHGQIEVLNRCWKGEDLEVESWVQGIAWQPDLAYPGRLKVRFFWPFTGHYWVLRLDPDYQWVLVGTPNRKGLWILSRSGEIDQMIYQDLLEWSREQGFPVEKMQNTPPRSPEAEGVRRGPIE